MGSNIDTHEIDGIGEFRARAGTSVSELAGAAKYWSDRAKSAEKRLSENAKSGFFTGLISAAILVMLLEAALHFLAR